MVNRTRIDNLLMDNEGPEYDLIPMIIIDNVLPEKNIVICQMNVEFWKEFGEVIGYCVSDTEIRRIRLTPLKNTDEVKYYLFNENGSEFFGADPISERNAELFSRVGTFIPVAVSNTSAQAESIVYANRTYKKMRVKHVDFKTFVMEIIDRTRIDHLAIDTEGAEDDIFPMIAIDDTLLRYNITICHMNVE
ncbi:hypothetical protein TELCIR_13740, partial [Teladorsagia circumcincta]